MRNLPGLIAILTAIVVAFGAAAGSGGMPAAEAGVCGDGAALFSFSDDASYSGPGPFNAFVLVVNSGTAAATDVVLAFEVVEGGEFFHEAVFGNEQLWWAHGAPDAGVLYVVPEVPAQASVGVRFVATMRPEWGGDARTVIRVSVVRAECAEPSSDEVLVTFSATSDGASSEPTATAEPALTATVAATPTAVEAVSTVLGAAEAPTGAATPETTSTPPSGEILPEGGEGGGGRDSASSAALVVAGVAIALLFLGVGVMAGRIAPR